MIEVETTSTHCLTFPALPSPMAPRDNLLSRITGVLQRTRMAFVVGDPGIGKTVLLAQYALDNPRTSASVFLKPDRIGLTNPSLMRREIYAQATFMLEGRLLGKITDPNDEEYQRTLIRLAHRAKQSLGPVQFIVDGFSEQPAEFQEVILRSILPLSMAQQMFKFVVSGVSVPDSVGKVGRDYEIVQVPGLARAEGGPLLEGLGLEDDDRARLLDAVSDGHPGRLGVLRRELQSGADPRELAVRARSQYEKLIGLEWERATETEPDAIRLLATLAFARSDYSEEELAVATEMDQSRVSRLLADIPFVVRSKAGWTLATPAHQEYAQEQTGDLQPTVIHSLADLALGDRQKTPDYPMAIEYFAEAKEYESILSLVSPEALESVVETSHGFEMAGSLAQRAALAAHELERLDSEFRMLIRSASAGSLARSEVLGPVVTTLLGLGHLDAAQEAAAACPILNERFRLLARVGRRQMEDTGVVHPDVLASIDGLLDSVSTNLLTDEQVEAGADLFAFHPLAAAKLARLAHDRSLGDGSGDRFLVAVALVAGPPRGRREDSKAYEAFIGEAESEEGRSALSRLAHSLASNSLFEVLDEAGMWDDESFLPFLERIAPTLARRGPDEAVKVLTRLAESVTAASTSRLPRIRALATTLSAARRHSSPDRLSDALEHVQPIAEAEQSVPTLDAVALLLEIAMVQAHADTAKDIAAQLHDVRDLVESLQDSSLRLEGLGLVYGACVELLAANRGEGEELLADLRHHIQERVHQIAGQTGLHDTTLSRPLRLLARTDLGFALELSNLANTARRRNQLHDECIREHLAAPESLRNCLGLAFSEISDVESQLRRPALLKALLESIADATPSDRKALVTPLRWAHSQIMSLSDRESRTALLADLVAACPPDGTALAEIRELGADSLLSDLQASKTPWEVLDAIGTITQNRAVSPAQVEALNALASRQMQTAEIMSRETNQLYAWPVHLAVLGVAGAIIRGQESPQDEARLAAVIARLPRAVDRLAAWERLIMLLWANRLKDEAIRLAEKHVLLELERIPSSDKGDYTRAVIIAAPALYVTNRDLLALHMRTIEQDAQRIAWSRIAETLIRRRSVFDAFSEKGFTHQYSRADALELLEALDHTESDDQILWGLTALERSIDRYQASMSGTQRVQVANRAKSLVEQRLPSATGIQHEGYVIWGEAVVEKIRTRSLKGPTLDSLVRRTRQLENTSDKAFLLTVLAGLAAKSASKENLLNEATRFARSIDVGHERIERMYSIAEGYAEFNTDAAKKVLVDAWNQAGSQTQTSRASSKARKRAIDLAYSISPDFARELSVLLDNDAARLAHREVERRSNLLEVRDRVLNPSESSPTQTDEDTWMGAEATWEALGAINAGMAAPIEPSEALAKTRRLIERGIDQGFPAMCMYLTSLIEHPAKPDARGILLRDAVDAALDMAEYVYASYGRIHGRRIPGASKDGTSAVADVIEVGDRDGALRYLREWLEDNATERIVLADGYFGPDDLTFLRLCLEACPRVPVHIITSQKVVQKELGDNQPADGFEAAWRSMSVQRPPQCTIHIVGLRPTGKSPIHPRVLFGDTRSLMLDGSFNGLGVSTVSVFTPVRPDQQARLLDEFIEPIMRGEVIVGGQPITSSRFGLG